MQVIPAIDIRGGRCVQLYQGDYSQETVYSDDPADQARRWAEMGALWIHVVDLDGARTGAPANMEAVASIVSAVETPVQLGGGIRTLQSASDAVSLGVRRVILGTAAVESEDLVQTMCLELGPEAVVVSVDARDGVAVLDGWTRSSRVPVAELVGHMAEIGVRRIMYTDVARDGTLTEPNFRAIEALAGQTGLRLLAAGGISSLEHLVKLSRMGVEGAIIGTALYTGDIDLGEAIGAVDEPVHKPR